MAESYTCMRDACEDELLAQSTILLLMIAVRNIQRACENSVRFRRNEQLARAERIGTTEIWRNFQGNSAEGIGNERELYRPREITRESAPPVH